MQELKQGTPLQGGKYIIKRVLGQGGFGITYLAEQVLLAREVAIKEFFIRNLCDRDSEGTLVSTTSQQSTIVAERYKQKFLKEANTISSLHHANIISIFDVFEENDTAYYVMEYIKGGSLQNLINRNHKMSESEAITCISYIASAVDYIHTHNINHYDIKPANILIRQDGTPVLIDFGISKSYDSSGNRMTTMPVGISDGYAPIEQYSNDGTLTFSPQADIYSLGATLYKLVTGQTPPSAPARTSGETLLIPTDLKESTRRTIDSAMRLKRNERIDTAKAFLSMLSGEDMKKKDSPKSKVWPILLAIGCLLALGIGYLIYNTTRVSKTRLDTSIVGDSTAILEQDSAFASQATDEPQTPIQNKTYTFNEKYGDTTYRYSVKVYDGNVTWSLKCPGEKYNGAFKCNPEIDPDIILEEFKGVIYWAFASKYFWRMAEELGYYRYDEYQWAKRSFSNSVSSFGKARKYCPSAYKKVQSMYKDLINAENSVDALWDEICLLSYALGEHPIEACDLYECDY